MSATPYRIRYVRATTRRCGEKTPKDSDRRINHVVFAGDILNARDADFIAHHVIVGNNGERDWIIEIQELGTWSYGARKILAGLRDAIRKESGKNVRVRFVVPHTVARWRYPIPRGIVFADLETAKKSICK